ncbi:MAG: isoprenyl transferase [Bacteroidota bacterium]
MTKVKKETDIEEMLKQRGEIPAHVAIIMDGNGRWARKRGLPRVAGHRRGVDTVREIVKVSASLGVKYLTLYTFSTENWKRPKDEVSMLMRLIVKSLQNETDELHANNIRITTIGDFSSLPADVQQELNEATKKTAGNTKMTLNLALSYSGRWELVEAVKKIAGRVQSGELAVESIDESVISNSLITAGIPDPDLLIRTSGEFRVSNFLLWQIAYTEFVIVDALWPEFSREHFYRAIESYQNRERRFGLVSEQISTKIKV